MLLYLYHKASPGISEQIWTNSRLVCCRNLKNTGRQNQSQYLTTLFSGGGKNNIIDDFCVKDFVWKKDTRLTIESFDTSCFGKKNHSIVSDWRMRIFNRQNSWQETVDRREKLVLINDDKRHGTQQWYFGSFCLNRKRASFTTTNLEHVFINTDKGVTWFICLSSHENACFVLSHRHHYQDFFTEKTW